MSLLYAPPYDPFCCSLSIPLQPSCKIFSRNHDCSWPVWHTSYYLFLSPNLCISMFLFRLLFLFPNDCRFSSSLEFACGGLALRWFCLITRWSTTQCSVIPFLQPCTPPPLAIAGDTWRWRRQHCQLHSCASSPVRLTFVLGDSWCGLYLYDFLFPPDDYIISSQSKFCTVIINTGRLSIDLTRYWRMVSSFYSKFFGR